MELDLVDGSSDDEEVMIQTGGSKRSKTSHAGDESSSSSGKKSAGKAAVDYSDPIADAVNAERAKVEPHLRELLNENKKKRLVAMSNIRKVWGRIKDSKVKASLYLTVLAGPLQQQAFRDESETVCTYALEILEEALPATAEHECTAQLLPETLIELTDERVANEKSEDVRQMKLQLLEALLKELTLAQVRPHLNDLVDVVCKTLANAFRDQETMASVSGIVRRLCALCEKRELRGYVDRVRGALKPSLRHNVSKVRLYALRALCVLVVQDDSSEGLSMKDNEMFAALKAMSKPNSALNVHAELLRTVETWLVSLVDRHVFYYKLFPFVLTALGEQQGSLRTRAYAMMARVGEQYDHRNREAEDFTHGGDDLQTRELPAYDETAAVCYPVGLRSAEDGHAEKLPDYNFRLMIRDKLKAILDPIVADMVEGWQSDARLVACRQLHMLLALTQEYITQYLDTVVDALVQVTDDHMNDKQRGIMEHVEASARLLGFFVPGENVLQAMLPPGTVNPNAAAASSSSSSSSSSGGGGAVAGGPRSDRERAHRLFLLSQAVLGMREPEVLAPLMGELLEALAQVDLSQSQQEEVMRQLVGLLCNVVSVGGSACSEHSYALFRQLVRLEAAGADVGEGMAQLQAAVGDAENVYGAHVGTLLSELGDSCGQWTALSVGGPQTLVTLMRGALTYAKEEAFEAREHWQQMLEVGLAVGQERRKRAPLRRLLAPLMLDIVEAYSGREDPWWEAALAGVVSANCSWRAGKDERAIRAVMMQVAERLGGDEVMVGKETLMGVMNSKENSLLSHSLSMLECDDVDPEPEQACVSACGLLEQTMVRVGGQLEYEVVHAVYETFLEKAINNRNSDAAVNAACKMMVEVVRHTEGKVVNETTGGYITEKVVWLLVQPSVCESAAEVIRALLTHLSGGERVREALSAVSASNEMARKLLEE